MPEDPAPSTASSELPQLQLSVIQVVGTAAAAVTAAVLCSFLGVVGTVVGTAVTSIVVTSGGALYQHSLRRTQARLRHAHTVTGSTEPMTQVLERARRRRRGARRDIPWRIVLLGTANVFVFAIALITGIEGALGSSLSAEFGVGHSGSDRTSLGSALGIHHHRRPRPATSPTATPTPAVSSSSTPQVSPSAVAPTATVTQTVTSTPGTSPPSTPAGTSTSTPATPAGTTSTP